MAFNVVNLTFIEESPRVWMWLELSALTFHKIIPGCLFYRQGKLLFLMLPQNTWKEILGKKGLLKPRAPATVLLAGDVVVSAIGSLFSLHPQPMSREDECLC